MEEENTSPAPACDPPPAPACDPPPAPACDSPPAPASDPPLASAPDSTSADVVADAAVEPSETATGEMNEERDAAAKDESGIVPDTFEDRSDEHDKEFAESASCGAADDARSLDLDSLPAADELALAAGSDSGVEGCGRALSSGGGSRSCASSVVSCGSGCGSESSSVAGAPPRPRRRLNVAVAEPKRGSPVSSGPRPATAPRGPNLATRERARSREKPTPPEKPRPLTPKPRIRPTTDLPNLVRESPALRAKPTRTSAARCRTPNSPVDDRRWPTSGPRLAAVADAAATRGAADKYGTLPRRRRDADAEGSPKHEAAPPPRRLTVSRSVSSRGGKTRVRIYAEKVSQTVLLGADVEAALAGIVPNIESRVEVSRCDRGVQATSRDSELARLTAAAAAATASAAEERERRAHAEAQLAAERAARLAAIAELERNSQRLLELAGAGAGAGADGCLRALEEQLRSASELAARQRHEIDALRDNCDKLHAEACQGREQSRSLAARLAEAEQEAAEMHDFLAAETGALGDSLRDADAEIARLSAELDRRRGECRQLVRMCEQRRQEALAAAAVARAAAGAEAGAGAALDALARRLRRLTEAVRAAYALPPHATQPNVYHNEAYSRSDSGETLSPDDETRGGLLGAIARALKAAAAEGPVLSPGTAPHTPGTAPGGPHASGTAPLLIPQAPGTAPNTPGTVPHTPGTTPGTLPHDDDRSRASDDNDNSADLLDSETEPCFVNDPEYAEEWWSGAEGAGAWSGDELSPERESCPDPDREAESVSVSERSLRSLSAAIAARQRSEAAAERCALRERVLTLDTRLGELLRALAAAARAPAAVALAQALRDKIDVTEKNVADVVVKKLAELDASRAMLEHYRQSVEALKNQAIQPCDEDDAAIMEELESCEEEERRRRCEALRAALRALPPRLTPLRAALTRLSALAPAAAPASACT